MSGGGDQFAGLGYNPFVYVSEAMVPVVMRWLMERRRMELQAAEDRRIRERRRAIRRRAVERRYAELRQYRHRLMETENCGMNRQRSNDLRVRRQSYGRGRGVNWTVIRPTLIGTYEFREVWRSMNACAEDDLAATESVPYSTSDEDTDASGKEFFAVSVV